MGKLHSAAVEFGKVECCALKSAIGCGLYDEFIKATITKAQKTEMKYKWSLLVESFVRTTRLAFIPAPTHCNFYLNLALQEKAHLKAILLKSEKDVHGEPYFLCGHSLIEHIKALDNVIFMMSCPQGRN